MIMYFRVTMKFKSLRNLSVLSVVLIFIGLTACQKDPDELREARVQDLISEVKADSLKSYVRWLEGMGTRFALADNHREVAEQIRDRFVSFGYPSARLDSFNLVITYRGTTYSTWQYNVVAVAAGKGNDNISIVGAHYDNYSATGDPFTVAPGANDNATGVAAIMEMARIIRKTGFRPNYTIRFVAFAAEELGLKGSGDYASKVAEAGDNVMMMLNYDMIGYQAHPTANPWQLNIMDYDNSAGLRDEAARLCDANTNLVAYSDNTYNHYSDSYSFFLIGYPALFFFQSSTESTYHTDGDVISVCNFDYCRQIVKASFSLLLDKNMH